MSRAKINCEFARFLIILQALNELAAQDTPYLAQFLELRLAAFEPFSALHPADHALNCCSMPVGYFHCCRLCLYIKRA
jgi:hypothetical protein